MGKEDMRGLTLFISDIRECKSPEAEAKRINKELANIRQKFGDKKPLDGYQKKKYVCKLLFIFLLGHDVEFGHMEAVNLMSSIKYSEKQMGYLFVSVLMSEHHDLLKLISTSIKTDLTSSNELYVCLALNCVANIGSPEIATAVYTDVLRLLIEETPAFFVRKKAALTLLRFYRRAPEEFPHGEFTTRIIQVLNHPDVGVLMAAASLVTSLAMNNPTEYAPAVAIVATRLQKILFNPQEATDYQYYAVAAPWLTVKLLRLLQVFPLPEDHAVAQRINECLSRIINRATELPLTRGESRPRPQFFNANYSCFFEAINLLVSYDHDSHKDMQIKAVTQLGNFLVHKEVNLRYLALEGLYTMAQTEFSRDAVRKHQPTVLKTLKKEKDTTVQQRCADVLYAVCDEASVTTIVGELADFLEKAEYSVREELVLKIAILAEKFVTDYKWYVDVILRLIRTAGDHLAEEVWHRVLQIIINRPDIQDYAAKTCYEALLDPASHEAMVNVGGYVLGEFGHLIANDPNSSPIKQLELLQSHYPLMSAQTRSFLLTTYVKFANIFPEIKPRVIAVLNNPTMLRNADAEIQQRANEYLQLLQVESETVLPAVLEEMPPFVEKESGILAKLEKAHSVTDVTGTAVVAKKRVAKELKQVTAAGQADASAAAAAPAVSTIANEALFPKFFFANNGVLYENPVLQIGVQSTFNKSSGTVTLYFGNRGTAPMTSVSTTTYMPENPQSLRITTKPVDATIAPGVQATQAIQVDCLGPFVNGPLLDVNLTYQSRHVLLTLRLPVTLNKFLAPLPTPLTADEFFAKWKQLGGPPREVRHIIESREKINVPAVTLKVADFGFPPLPAIDPNPNNLVSAAILHTENGQVGALLRVEPNMEKQMFRFTLRASNDGVAKTICDQLAVQMH